MARVVCLELGEGCDEMRALRVETERRVVALGCGRESKTFRPHLTLSRCKRDAEGEWTELRDLVSNYRPEPIRWLLDPVTLSQSSLGPSGATYRVLESVPLCDMSPVLEGDY